MDSLNTISTKKDRILKAKRGIKSLTFGRLRATLIYRNRHHMPKILYYEKIEALSINVAPLQISKTQKTTGLSRASRLTFIANLSAHNPFHNLIGNIQIRKHLLHIIIILKRINQLHHALGFPFIRLRRNIRLPHQPTILRLPIFRL